MRLYSHFCAWLRRIRRTKSLQPFFYPYYRIKATLEIRRLRAPLDPFFSSAKGVIHIGANNGGEILFYAQHKLPVLWIEANPEIFPRLLANLRGIPRQVALLGLVGSQRKENVEFHVSNNHGASSSVYLFDQHKSIWPDVDFVKKIYLPQVTLPQLLDEAGISFKSYDTLVMDVQGAELQILKGIPDLSEKFEKVQLEACNFPAYRGAPMKEELDAYLQEKGFKLVSAQVFAMGKNGERSMDCRYLRSSLNLSGQSR